MRAALLLLFARSLPLLPLRAERVVDFKEVDLGVFCTRFSEDTGSVLDQVRDEIHGSDMPGGLAVTSKRPGAFLSVLLSSHSKPSKCSADNSKVTGTEEKEHDIPDVGAG